ncbi:peroxidase 1-like [Silene latifolia]|uniref:peroxidase 1-like n=1 Tax=Silene latifolia TaxID=37657 RepID=UPI003D77962C
MTTHKLVSVFTIFAMFVVMANANGLTLDYYKYSCPDAEAITKRITDQYVGHVPNFAPGLLRMHFHDCIVRGCDASVLLDPTPSNNKTEKDSIPNSTLRGFEVINAIKGALEEKCPGIVSCADILSLAARDAIVKINGPYWHVPLGRKDGIISLASEALANIPSPFSNFTTLKQNFAAVGLSSKDLVVLSGAHTIGIGHCFIIQSRLYNFTGKGDTDPKLAPSYAKWLKTRCPKVVGDVKSFVYMDRITPKAFDEKYYTMVTQHRGLFESDAALLDDSETKNYIETQVYTQGETFPKDFAESITRMSLIGVLTGSQGQVRKTCGAVNYY